MRCSSHISCLSRRAWKIICIVCLCGGLTSCHWHEAKEVIATADNLDQTEHLIYDDTAALGKSIRCLDNPFGRVLMSNTLGKAYYYMGRNLIDKYGRINQAAECYIMADRLQINDPIYRGRVNSCMGYICAQNNSDSLALIFYERANKAFKKSTNEWYYAQSLLNVSLRAIHLHLFSKTDSLLLIAHSYQLDSAYRARYYETKGLYFYEQQQYDSALVYFNQGLNYWQSETEKCFSYVKIMQTYYFGKKDLQMLIPYANLIVKYSNNPNHLANAYYCLLLDAKENNDVNRLSQYTHARTDALKVLRDNTNKYAEATPKLMEYLQNPHPWRWIRITLFLSIILCAILAISIAVYRKLTTAKIQLSTAQINSLSLQIKKHEEELNKQLDVLSTHIRIQEADILHQQSLLVFEKRLTEIRDKYHSPRNQWRNYSTLKKDIAPWLRDWTAKLDTLPLSEQEKIFCTISLIYTNLSDIKIADYMCYTKGSIRVLKNRILKKIGISSSEFSDFLYNLSNCK